jgi:hypothetical protein
MRVLHLALSVSNVAQSIEDYSSRLRAAPVVVISGEYALWRTETLNLSIRKTSDSMGALRHLGWEDSAAVEFTTEIDCNGIAWEKFAPFHQAQEINKIWPDTNYLPT